MAENETNENNAPASDAGESSQSTFTQNITEAITKLNQAREGLVKRFEQAKDEAPEDTATIKVVAAEAAEIIGEGTAKAKAAYEAAGRFTGISQATTKKAAELGAKAKVLQESIADSKVYQSALESVKQGANKAAQTNFFKNVAEEAKKLKDIATQTYNETYEAKKAQTKSDDE